MLVQLFVFCSPLFYTGISAQEDLEIVGSDNHIAFAPRTKDDGMGAGYYHDEDATGKFDFPEHEDPPDFNYPVKTVQRFKDADGNVKIVTSYSNRDDNPLPIYKDVALRQRGLEQARAAKSEPEKITKDKAEPLPKVVPFVTTAAPRVDKFEYLSHIEPRASRPIKQEFSTTKTVKFPNKDGQLFADQHETSSRDGTSSSYNQKSSFKTNYKKPQLKVIQSSGSSEAVGKEKDKDKPINSAPLLEAGSSYVSDIDHGVVDGPSFDGGGEGYAEGSSSYSSGGNEYSDYGRGGDDGPAVYEAVDDGGYAGGVEDHGDSAGVYHAGGDEGIAHHGGGGVAHHGHSHGSAFKKGHGASYQHGNKAVKGEEGGKGHAKKEQYEKGHSESHGHEAQKGGEKGESGGKSGHLDESNQYGKGHAEEHGGGQKAHGHSKGHKKGHKTKGFRTVHHKDEYKKDEVFYDDEHDAGYQKGHGNHHHSQKKVKGGGHKKGHLNSGYKHGHKGFHGDKEKGHSYKNSKGHAGSSGHSHHKGHQSHFDKAAGHKGGEAHGHEHYKKGH